MYKNKNVFRIVLCLFVIIFFQIMSIKNIYATNGTTENVVIDNSTVDTTTEDGTIVEVKVCSVDEKGNELCESVPVDKDENPVDIATTTGEGVLTEVKVCSVDEKGNELCELVLVDKDGNIVETITTDDGVIPVDCDTDPTVCQKTTGGEYEGWVYTMKDGTSEQLDELSNTIVILNALVALGLFTAVFMYFMNIYMGVRAVQFLFKKIKKLRQEWNLTESKLVPTLTIIGVCVSLFISTTITVVPILFINQLFNIL